MQRTAIVIAPMGIGEVLDAGFSLARGNFRTLATMTAWGAVPSYAAITIAGSLIQSSRISLVVLGVVLFVLGGVGMALLTAAVVMACARLVQPSEGTDSLHPAELYSLAAVRLLPVFLLAFVWALVAVPLIILFPLGIFVFIRWSMAYVAILVEGAGPLESMRRSWAITRGAWWHTAVVVVAGSLITGILSGVLSGLVGVIAGVLLVITGSQALAGALTVAGQSLGAIALEPFSAAIGVVLYYELRARSEGFDLAQRVAHFTPAGQQPLAGSLR